MVSTKIYGGEYSISKIFSDDFSFEVPPYQRPYAWTVKQAGELLDDLLEALGNSDHNIDLLNPYFLGSIVLIKDSEPLSQIIDGQQRLTTLTILFAALRASLPKKYSKNFDSLIYQEGDEIRNTPDTYRLSVRGRDNDFFQRHIQKVDGFSKLSELNNRDLTDSQKCLKENALYFLSQLTQLPEEKQLQLAQFIVIRCYVVVVSTPDMDSAYKIFSVLNDRGLNLNNSDIFKADVIGKISSHYQRDYSDKWEDIEESLGRSEFDRLLSHIRSIRKKRNRTRSILEDLRAILAEIEGRDFIDDILSPYSQAFYSIENQSFASDDEEKARGINTLLRWLSKVNHSDWIPVAIIYFSGNRNKPQNLMPFFQDLERLAVYLWAQDLKDNQRIHRYSQVMEWIEEGKDVLESNSPLQLQQNEKGFLYEVLDGDLYDRSRLCRYVLSRVDQELSEGTAFYDYPNVTVEHILPRNPGSKTDWKTWFAGKNQMEKYVNRIGNLVLLSKQKNKEARNYSFQEKKDRYFSGKTGVSSFALTTQVLKESKWTPYIIDKRQKELVDILATLWRL